MAVQNPSFETPGLVTGTAEDWSGSQSDGAESIAAFTHYDGDTRPFESFEQSWLDNHLFQTGFGLADLITPLFSDGTSMEYFEYGWSAPASLAAPYNNSSAFVFVPANHTLVQFNTATDDQEDFESNWDSNESFVSDGFEGSGVLAAATSFDSGTPESVEDFEEEWLVNQTANITGVFSGVGVDLAVANFDPSAPVDHEKFDSWTTVLS